MEEDGSRDGRNKKVENLESQPLRFFSAAQTPARILVRKKRGENAEEGNEAEYKDFIDDDEETKSKTKSKTT